MRCHEVHEWMSLRLDGCLPAAEERQLEAHLAGCPACTAAWAEWQEIASLFEGAPLALPPEDLTAKVLARVHKPRWGAFAGSVIAMVAGLGLLGALLLWPLAGACSAAMTTAQMPGLLGVMAAALAQLLETATLLAGTGRIVLLALLTPHSAAAAMGYALLTMVALMGWLRMVSHRRMPRRGAAGL
ncbi:MAG TPA: anti-sigma factor [Anaerolineae bacterium]|nr:anti-sigma factor [Anaerolineae bacterium]HOQ97453.1 anti-sigma factor [Anaerolineae bacterium]HPL30574.1 anti-sigma factor [Anaerolineae bacterium]